MSQPPFWWLAMNRQKKKKEKKKENRKKGKCYTVISDFCCQIIFLLMLNKLNFLIFLLLFSQQIKLK